MNPGDALALLREAQDRVLDREGIPMLLALTDETGETGETDEIGETGDEKEPDGASGTEGLRLASSMEDLGQALAPAGRNEDMGRVITVLQALSYLDFGQPRSVL